MRAAESTHETGITAWNNSTVSLTLIIPTVTLPTEIMAETVTRAHIPAPTQLAPTTPMEGSGNAAQPSASRRLMLFYLLLLGIKTTEQCR